MIVRSSAAIVALIAVGSTYALWSDNVAVCGNTFAWLLTVMLASPMVLMFLSVWLVAFAPTEQERTIWLVLVGVVMVSYVLAFLAAGAMVAENF